MPFDWFCYAPHSTRGVAESNKSDLFIEWLSTISTPNNLNKIHRFRFSTRIA